ncbi:MAG: hypothetical protein IPM54_12345 [Polyangiaceae bacterium]|nr:hypothetical protein [Polyangiaceae bacterium]
MKKKIQISFDAERLPGDASAILGPAGCGAEVANIHDYTVLNYRRVTVRLELDDRDPRIAKVIALLQHYGEQFDMCSFIEYSEEDRQSARLLLMSADIKNSFHVSLRGGTKYDMSAACANCGAGAVQTIGTVRRWRLFE